MIRRRPLLRRLAAACAGLLALVAVTPSFARGSDDGRREAAAGGEILVMLRLSPDHLRPNAGYGGDYGDQTARLIRRRLAERIARRHGLEMVGDGWPMPLVGLDCYQMRAQPGPSADAVAAEVSRPDLPRRRQCPGGCSASRPAIGDRSRACSRRSVTCGGTGRSVLRKHFYK